MLFADLTNSMMQKGYLPKRRADNCAYEFKTFDHAFQTEIGPHIDPQMARTVMDTTWFPEPPSLMLPR